ncbi:phytanoyl-CoA dioxygenase family protein [Larkinella bovis]|uniref:Phytanoyl-CoA dioxygenase family protein n=1 Tax=Larkinella bovis TaxID=683041 RepID=A0ABW0ICT5_9BACT
MPFTSEHLQTYQRDGYVVVRNLFSKAEVERLYAVAVGDEVLSRKTYDRVDASGLKTRLALWYTLDDSVYSKLARSARIVNAVEQLLGGPAAHYHSKLMQKEPRTGGAWEWHQDYGYWYKNNGFLFPDMLSALTALTPATRENGCLQMIKGSHRMGRVEHGFTGEQIGADAEKVNEALKIMPLEYLEMEPGDTAFFHCNTLHASAANLSDKPRWSIITAYNLATNKPYKDIHESSYTLIDPYTGDLLAEEEAGISETADFLVKR